MVGSALSPEEVFQKTCVVVPALNEEKTIASVVQNVRRYCPVVVVSDGSTDQTAENAEQSGAVVVRHPKNLGYDSALSSGLDKAFELGFEYAVTMDADGQHNPTILEAYSKEFAQGFQLILGERNKKPRIAEHLFSWAARFRWGIKDPLCGMKGYHVDIYRKKGCFDSYKSIGTELAIFGVKNRFPFTHVPVIVRDRHDQPRFGRALSANLKILRALGMAFWKYGV